jgi:hypothetical protein
MAAILDDKLEQKENLCLMSILLKIALKLMILL